MERSESASADITQLQTEAQNYEKNGDFSAELKCYSKILVLNPDDADTLFKMARSRYRMGDFSLALELYNRAAVIKTDLRPWVYITWGHTLAALGMTEEAIDKYKALISLKPSEASLRKIFLPLVAASAELAHWQDVLTYAQLANELDFGLSEKLKSYTVTAHRMLSLSSKTISEQTENLNNGKQYQIVVCTAVKNEAPYLLEWIAYHRVMKVDHFFIYDNDSNDETTEILKRLDKAGFITHIPWPSRAGERPQQTAFQDGIRRVRGRSEWIAFIDVDEFIVLKQSPNLHVWLQSYETADAIAINWKLFGSSEHFDITNELVIERFTRCAQKEHPKNFIIKTIARVDCVKYAHAHMCNLVECSTYLYPDKQTFVAKGRPGTHVSHEVAQINHYCTKSRVEWEMKRNKGLVADERRDVKWLENHFISHDTNSQLEPISQAFVKATKKEMMIIKDDADISFLHSRVNSSLIETSNIATEWLSVLAPDQEIDILDIIYAPNLSAVSQSVIGCEIISPKLETSYSTNMMCIEGWVTGEGLNDSVVQISYRDKTLAEAAKFYLTSKLRSSHDSSPIKWHFLVTLPLVGLDSRSELGVQLKLASRRNNILMAAIRIDPKPIRKVVQSLMKEGKTNNAIEVCRERLRFNSSYWQALSAIGRVLLAEGDLDEAISYINKASIANPDSILLKYTMVEGLVRQKKMTDAYNYIVNSSQ